MRVHKWALAGVTAIVLAGCSATPSDVERAPTDAAPAPADVEPAPTDIAPAPTDTEPALAELVTLDVEPAAGELDFEIAVTRSALDHASFSPDAVYDPWSRQFVDLTRGKPIDVSMDQQLEVGLDYVCSTVDADQMDPLRRVTVDAVVHVAIGGAVISSASEDFRDAYAVFFRSKPNLTNLDDEQLKVATDANDLLATDLRDEWVELYELQESLRQDHFTLESAQQAQLKLAERCGVTLADAAIEEGEPQLSQIFAVEQPPPARDN